MLNKPTTFSYIAREDQNEYLSLCHSGTDTCGPDAAKGPWVKSMFQIHYVLEGRGVYTVDNRQHHLKPGDAFLIRPDKTVVYAAAPGETWRYCFFAFTGQAAEQYLSRTGFADDDVIHIDDDRINELVCETTEMLSLYPRNADMYALSQLMKLLFLFAEHHEASNVDKGQPLRSDLQQVLDFISCHYQDPITVMDMSRLVALERSYFCRIFTNAMGISPKDYLTKFRLDKARYYLIETSLPIGEISERVGFHSFSSFSRLFTAQYQQSPSQYRKTFLQAEADTPCLGSH